MKSIISNTYFKKLDLNAVLLSLYLTFVWFSYLFVFVTRDKRFLILLTVFLGIITYSICHWGLHFISKVSIDNKKIPSTKSKLLVLGISTAICLSILMIWFVQFSPGSFSPDSISQYEQALHGNYSDWHPVWHTLLFFTLPLKLTGEIGSIVLFQIIYFSAIIGYASMTLYKHVGIKGSILGMSYILLNPYTELILLYPWKDVGFAISCMLAMAMIIEIYLSSGTWSNQWWRCVLLGLTLTNATLFRHNGFFFTLPALVTLVFIMNKKQWMKVTITFVVCLILIKGPIYYALNVESPSNRVSEGVGLPLTIIGNVAKETPEVFDRDTLSVIYKIASKEDWQNIYICGNFNSIKWQGANLSFVDKTSLSKILEITTECFIQSPKSSLIAFFSLTDMVYGIETGLEGDISLEMANNDYGITYSGAMNPDLSSFMSKYHLLMSQTIFKYLRSIGVSMIIMLYFLLGTSNLKVWEDWKKLALCLPIFTYNFGTMLLLSGPDSRFFYVSFLICPLVVCLAICKRKEQVDKVDKYL